MNWMTSGRKRAQRSKAKRAKASNAGGYAHQRTQDPYAHLRQQARASASASRISADVMLLTQQRLVPKSLQPQQQSQQFASSSSSSPSLTTPAQKRLRGTDLSTLVEITPEKLAFSAFERSSAGHEQGNNEQNDVLFFNNGMICDERGQAVRSAAQIGGLRKRFPTSTPFPTSEDSAASGSDIDDQQVSRSPRATWQTSLAEALATTLSQQTGAFIRHSLDEAGIDLDELLRANPCPLDHLQSALLALYRAFSHAQATPSEQNAICDLIRSTEQLLKSEKRSRQSGSKAPPATPKAASLPSSTKIPERREQPRAAPTERFSAQKAVAPKTNSKNWIDDVARQWGLFATGSSNETPNSKSTSSNKASDKSFVVGDELDAGMFLRKRPTAARAPTPAPALATAAEIPPTKPPSIVEPQAAPSPPPKTESMRLRAHTTLGVLGQILGAATSPPDQPPELCVDAATSDALVVRQHPQQQQHHRPLIFSTTSSAAMSSMPVTLKVEIECGDAGAEQQQEGPAQMALVADALRATWNRMMAQAQQPNSGRALR